MPRILNPRDVIVKITLSTVCGSDLHLYGGYVPSMQKGDILGHEMVGEVVETGSDIRNLSVGDRVVVAFSIACGRCWYCQNNEFSLCDNSNPNAAMMEKMYGFSAAGVSAIRICSADTPALRPSTCACRLPTWAPSRSPTA